MAKKSDLPLPLPTWAYFLDVDGTLIEFAKSPDAVRIDDALLGLVARLHQACGGALALVSGRSIADLDYRLGSIRVPLAGQHGLERRNAAGRLRTHSTTSAEKLLILRSLEPAVAGYPGLLLEDKGQTLALHYRQAPGLASYAHRLMRTAVAPSADRLCLQKGKYVVEIKPRGFDKGSAIEEFMAESPFMGRHPVFIGDDVTDELGFDTVNRLGGISVKVGAGKTRARWRLRDVAAVRKWLAIALSARS